MLEIGVFLWVSYTSLPQEGGAQAQPIFRFPSIYPYTFDAGIHIGEGLVFGWSATSPPPQEAGSQRSTILGFLTVYAYTLIAELYQIWPDNTCEAGGVYLGVSHIPPSPKKTKFQRSQISGVHASIPSAGGCSFEFQPGLFSTKVYSAFHPSRVGKWVPAAVGKPRAGVHPLADEMQVQIIKTVISLDNACYLNFHV